MLFKQFHNETLDNWLRVAENGTVDRVRKGDLPLTNDSSSSSGSRGKSTQIRAGIRIANLVPDDSGLYTVQASLLDGLLTANLSLRLNVMACHISKQPRHTFFLLKVNLFLLLSTRRP